MAPHGAAGSAAVFMFTEVSPGCKLVIPKVAQHGQHQRSGVQPTPTPPHPAEPAGLGRSLEAYSSNKLSDGARDHLDLETICTKYLLMGSSLSTSH